MEIKFHKVHTVKDLILSAIILAAGIGLYFVNAGTGIVVAACGAVMLLFYRSAYKRQGEDILLSKKAMDISKDCRTALKEFLAGKDTEPEITAPGSSGVIRIEVYFNAEAELAYAQLFDFANYTYEESTEMVELRGERAARLIGKI